MAIGSKEIAGYIRKIPAHTRRASRRCVRDHPFVLCIVCFLLIIYRYFPSIFALFVASFPTILCTAILLGLLLSYGEPNIPETKEEDKRFVNGEAKDASSLVRKHHEGAIVASGSDKRSVGKKDDHGFSQKNESIPSEEDRKRSGKPKVEIDHVDHCEAASESDQSEISSSDASEIIPMLDELHPLLDSEAPQPSAASKDGSDAVSTQSSHDRESEDGNSIEEETENQEDDEEEDEDEEEEEEEEEEEGAQGEKDADAKVVEWTADDQKNLMSVGSSEIERNQRLENLIARRRARKFVRSEMEKNLIDLDGNESLPTIEELSKFQVQIPQVFAPRRNPFDLPFDSDDTIPGSAPSVLLPTRNPFDLPYEQPDESNNTAGKGDDNINNNNNNHSNNNSTNQGFVPLPPRDLLYRRHESFTIGESFLGDLKQDLRPSRLRPFFVAEKENTEETNFADLEREFSEKSESKLSEGQEYSDTVSSGNDQECDKVVVEDEVNSQQSELATSHDNEAPKVESESSDDGESMHDELIKDEIKSTGTSEDNFKTMEEEIIDESASNSSISDDEEVVVTEDNNLKQSGSEAEHADENQVADPVYDSSPSARSLSNASALEEALLYADKGGSGHSPPRVDSSTKGVIWVAPSLACVEENEARSREVSQIRERDVLGTDLKEIREDFSHPIVPILPPRAASRTSRLSSLSSVEAESSDGSSN